MVLCKECQHFDGYINCNFYRIKKKIDCITGEQFFENVTCYKINSDLRCKQFERKFTKIDSKNDIHELKNRLDNLFLEFKQKIYEDIRIRPKTTAFYSQQPLALYGRQDEINMQYNGILEAMQNQYFDSLTSRILRSPVLD